jgi:hypothetical protein
LRQTRLVLGVALGLGLTAAAAAMAEPGGAPGTSLQAEVARRRPIVQPRPDPERVAREVDQAAADLAGLSERRQRTWRLVREYREALPRRPDLDPAITGAIQTRNLQRALQR